MLSPQSLAQPKTAINAEVAALIILTILPCAIVWFGLNVLHSALWAILLYHALVLVPGIVWGRSHWRDHVKWPTLPQVALLAVSSFVTCGAALFLYHYRGDMLLNTENTYKWMLYLGYEKEIFIPLGLYFVFINSALEELFWRGVMYNKICNLPGHHKIIGLAWSSLGYAAFHYSIFRAVLYPGWAEFSVVLLAIYGGWLALMYRRYKSIVLPSLMHAFTTDLCAMLLMLALFHRLHVPSIF